MRVSESTWQPAKGRCKSVAGEANHGRGDGVWTRGVVWMIPQRRMDLKSTNRRQIRMREYGVREVNRLAKLWKQRTEAIMNHYQYRKKF
jgi:hypothetical protein